MLRRIEVIDGRNEKIILDGWIVSDQNKRLLDREIENNDADDVGLSFLVEASERAGEPGMTVR